MAHIIFDVMGGEAGCESAVLAGCHFLLKFPEHHITFFGDQTQIQAVSTKYSQLQDRIAIVHAPAIAPGYIANYASVRHLQKTSLLQAIHALKQSKHKSFLITTGSTTVLVAGSVLLLPKNIDFPHVSYLGVISNLRPHHKTIMLDLGAKITATATALVAYARYGQLLARKCFNIARPKIALLNIGSEPSKGLPAQVSAYQLLQTDQTMNFIGNIEPAQFVAGTVDVLVCDGYAGNLTYKTVSAMLQV